MGIYIKGDFKNPYPNCDECIFGELIRCEAISRRKVYDYEVDCPLSEIEVNEDCITDIETHYVPLLAPEDDCISREYLIKALDNLDWYDFDMFYKVVENAPGVVPQAKEGEWRGEHKMPDMPRYEWYRCSECSFLSQNVVNYCPNCGAKMKGTAK